MSNLVDQFEAYSLWRTNVITALAQYRDALATTDLDDASSDQRLAHAVTRLADDKLTIAFVAEFSRGKSELINALFFAGYGQRVLPSSAGRTTMCPTELLYDETMPPCIRLLPIETRADTRSVSDYKGEAKVWSVLPLDIASGDGLLDAFKQVSLTKRVSVDDAKRYGLYSELDADMALAVDHDGMVEISCWRHAIVNFPHPLFKQGLVVIDTPGLNAIGTEPELTLNLIPQAHAVLFILAADTGVTKSDVDIWRQHIVDTGAGRMVVLNKIDSMWDELRTADEIDQEIAKQVRSVARTLDLTENQIFPVSAQKGLVGKINRDAKLLWRSRLPALEHALSAELIPSKQDIIRHQLRVDTSELVASKQALLAARSRNVVEQLIELKSLRGKNQTIVEHMMKRIDMEKKEFDASLFKLQATRAVFTRLSAEVFTHLGMSKLKQDVANTGDVMARSKFSIGLRDAIKQFFQHTQHNLTVSGSKINEITTMMAVMYQQFSTEHGLALSKPMPFSLDKYCHDLNMIEAIYQKQFGTAAILTTPQLVLMQKFFDSIMSRVQQCFLHANRDVDAWLKAVMAPLEAQIGEHKRQLKRRKQSIERIHDAATALEENVLLLEQMQSVFVAQKQTLAATETALHGALAAGLISLPAVA